MDKISSVDLYNFVNMLSNKDQDGSFTIDQYNSAVYSASVQLFEDYVGEIQKYQYGQPIPPIAYAKTAKIEADLNPFRNILIDVSSDDNGVILFDSLDSVPYYVTNLYRVDGDDVYPCVRLNEQRWAMQLKSRVAPPTSDFPFYLIKFNSQASTMEGLIAPFEAFDLKVSYLSLPEKRDVKYTVSVNGRASITPVGTDPDSSQYLQWGRQNFNDLAVRVLSFLGVNLKDNDLLQFAERKQIQGI